MSDEKIVKLLEEIRDLQKENVTRYDKYLQSAEERYDRYLGKIRKMLLWIVVIGIGLLLLLTSSW